MAKLGRIETCEQLIEILTSDGVSQIIFLLERVSGTMFSGSPSSCIVLAG
jgi:hypothetical protein